MTAITPYCKLGTTVLTSYLRVAGLKQRGGLTKMKNYLAPELDRSWISRKGRDPKVWKLGLKFDPGEETAFDDVLAAFLDAGENSEFYPFSAARFCLAASATATGDDPIRAGAGLLQQILAEVHCEIPQMFAATPTTWAPGWKPLDTTDGTGMVNAGKIAAPLYGLTVQAIPAGAGQAVATAIWYAVEEGFSFNGDPNRYILLRYRYVSGTFDIGSCNGIEFMYGTGGHGFGASHYKRIAINKDGEWHTAVFDMWDLTVGGTDWKDNAITGLEFIFWSVSGDVADVEYVVISEDAAGAAINKRIFAGDWNSVNNGTFINGEPEDLTATLMDGASAAGAVTLADSPMSSEEITMDMLGQIVREYIFDPAAIRGQEQFDIDFFWHAALVTALAGANNDLAIIAVLLNSELPSLKLTDPAGNDQVLSVSVAGNDIDVSLATGPAGAITSTSTLVVAAINAKAEAAALVTAAVDGSDGSGVVVAMAKTNVVGPDISSGKIALAECESVILKLTGPYPLSQNARLSLTPDIGAGAGLYRISVSTDSGSSYTEVFTSADLDDCDPNVLYLAGTRGYVTVWVKIECDQDLSVTLDDVKTYVERYVPEEDLPKIPVGATRKVKIDDSNNKVVDPSAVWRNRWPM